jgi:CBS domain-containing protein
MKVRDIMTRGVKIVSPADVLQSAAQLMEKNDFGMVPVGENDRLVGMLSDRDITVRAVARGLAPDRATVRDAMTTDVKYVYDDESVDDVSRHMSELQVRRLPVLNREKRLVGIVSLGDLAVKDPTDAGDALQSISQPGHH